MSHSTPLDSLSSDVAVSGPPADEERVRRILAEMNADAVVQPPPSGHNALPRVITEPPITTSTGELRMDSTAARANIIGGSIPTMADFHAMLQQTPPGMAPYLGGRPDMGAVVPQPLPASVNWKMALMNHLKGPIAVAIIIFFLNMPVVTNILSKYASWMYLGSGEISIGGLIVKALLAALLFAVYQTVTSFV